MKRTTLFFAAFAMTLAVAFTSCSKDDDNNNTPTPINGFTFSKVGNTATYELKTTVMGQTFNGTAIMTVIGKYSNNVAKVKMDLNLGIPGAPAQVDTSYWFVSSTEFADVDDSTGVNKFLYTTYNPALNTRYTMGEGTDSTYRDIVVLSENVATTAGAFECIKVRETNNTNEDENFFFINKSAGMVKILTTADGGQAGVINMEFVLKTKSY
jgi:hypothetical protein